MKLLKKCLAVILLLFAIYCLISLAIEEAYADELQPFDLKPAIVGTVLLIDTLPFVNKDLSWGHSIELEGWSYAATDIIGRFLPKEAWPMAPVIVTVFDVMYRIGEPNQGKLACDLLGVFGRVCVEIKF